MPTLEFSHEKMYTYVKGFASALGWNDVLRALSFARKAHEGQMRKDGQPYIVHPLTMACHAVALGIRNEAVIAALLLHDVCEDCGVKYRDLPVSRRAQETVLVLTRTEGQSVGSYYTCIESRPDAALAKIFDCCHNMSSMAGAASEEKMREWIEEKETYVYPLFRVVKDAMPEYSDALFILKYHILSVDNSVKYVLDMPCACHDGKEA